MKENIALSTTPVTSTITKKQSKFIDLFMATDNATQSYKDAGFKPPIPVDIQNMPEGRKKEDRIKTFWVHKAKEELVKPNIQRELQKRLEIRRLEGSARAGEVMFFLSEVMRGHIQDQFGLDAPLSERTRAAVELAKRTIDLQNKLEGKDTNPNIQISINWKRDN